MNPRTPFLISVFALTLPLASRAGTPDSTTCDSWMPAASCNYTVSSRPSSYPIQYMIIHKAEGTAAGSASWMQNCASGVSAHYNIDNNNGYCYQSLREKDIGWHAANWSTNCRSIGIEHGGYTSRNDTGAACYNKSSLETRSCISYYGLRWDRGYVIGHIQVPGATHTDPGVYWNWNYYMGACDLKVIGSIRDHYLALGSASGFLGFAQTAESMCPDGVGRYNHFAGGSIYWTSTTGAWEVHGTIRDKWKALGWEKGVCGYPTTDETPCPDGVGRFNHFTGRDGMPASIYWTAAKGAWEIHGIIRSKWKSLGWESGVCGYPITDESTCPDGVGRYTHFSKNASIYWSSGTGAWEVHGAIRDKWAGLGWEKSSLGYPVSDEFSVTVNGVVCKRNSFKNGTITFHPDTGTCTVP